MLAFITWDVDPAIFTLFGREVRWYGLLWGIGFLIGYEMMSRLFKHEKHPEAWVDKLFFYSIVSSVVGARLGHCVFYEWGYYSAHPMQIFAIWNGGLASHGGVFALIVTLMYYSKKVTHQSVWWLFDRMIPAVAVVSACIRLGNLMNSEIFGYPTTMPWGFKFVRSAEWVRDFNGLPCHPTQIYEMLYCIAALIVSLVMYWKFNLQKKVGLITGVSLIIFFGSRFALEFMKNPQVAAEVNMQLNIGQLLSIPLILLGAYLAITAMIKPDFKRLF